MKKIVVYIRTTFLLFTGIAMIIFNAEIFDILLTFFGPEKILGSQSVIYQDGICFYTNPRIMLMWICGICFLGIFLILTSIYYYVKFVKKATNNKLPHCPIQKNIPTD